ncbi:carbohydrate ABC transporter permease [Thermococcus gammatolerans]|uniref:ABC-type transport system, permease component, putative molybdate/tungstate transport n=1 Tax=Thermococcus gammatolerans (strain DSM 15229 / JCM 11827 / EJ3) TaxID=593117 RepID=C5A751_THEGJ|nr:sugar ABC transporter permease [Thermococcus gammatolerans]ACS34063.1 ABC-type transport system, permease component, putative molybdate/tungstate transport [Thermococcus gammatolerans EJ3]
MEKKTLLPYLLILPAFAYLMFFVGYPLVQALYLAFTKNGAFSLETLRRTVSDYYFWSALKYTLALAAVIVPIQLGLAIVLALLVNKAFKGKDMVIYALVIPLTISDVAAGLIWYSMLSPYGFLNKVLMNIGLISQPIYFFGYQYRSREFLAIVLAEVWRATSIVFVIILAGLQMISREYLEAAEVFGASYWTKLRRIVLPMLKPSIQSALIIRTLFAMQIFGIVWILAGRDIPVLAGEGFYQLTEIKDYGVASVYALIIAGLSILLGALYIKFLKAEYLEVSR